MASATLWACLLLLLCPTRLDAASREYGRWQQAAPHVRPGLGHRARLRRRTNSNVISFLDSSRAAGSEAANVSTAQPQTAAERSAAGFSDAGLVFPDGTTLETRRSSVVAAAKSSWNAYETFAMGYDELKPQSRVGSNAFGGLGATAIDSLDTLWMLGLKDEFARARAWVADKLSFNRDYYASVFETTIRVLGGLLSAYDLSGDRVFLARAEELGDILLAAYNTSSGLPAQAIDLRSRATQASPQIVLSELGTQQLELIVLSNKTSRPEFAAKAEAVIQTLHRSNPDKGLLPVLISQQTGLPATQAVSMGAMGDSYYEYLLKVWILKGRRKEDDLYRAMWEHAMDDMINRLVFKNNASGLTYVAETTAYGEIYAKMDHLVCFVPAMLALGVHAHAVADQKAAKYLDLAEELGRTCWQMYAQMPSGLAPDFVVFSEHGLQPGTGAVHNVQRPETFEALFVLWRVTGKPMYREWAWSIFQSFDRECKVAQSGGYAGVMDVTALPVVNDDTMQSFWLAETLKYAWLIFAPPDALDLRTHVLNTEAHPMQVLQLS